jgi:transcriptional regulator with XRE-family HTH domain
MQLAKRLQALKARTNRSYEALARRVGVSSSTLHRYCRGESIPADFGVLARFGTVCGATQQEATELLEYWALTMKPDAGADRNQYPAATRRLWLPAVIVAAAGVLTGTVFRRYRRS